MYRNCETEADLDKSLSTITMSLLQDTSSRSSSSDEDDINDISFTEVIGADGTSAPVTMGSESPVKSLAAPETIITEESEMENESLQPSSSPYQVYTDGSLDMFQGSYISKRQSY